MMEVRFGEVVKVRLLGFSAAPFSLNTSQSRAFSLAPSNIFKVVSWSNDSQTLSLTIGEKEHLRRGQAVRITLLAEGEGALSSPPRGVRFGAEVFSIAVDSSDGRVLPTDFAVTQSVGSIVPGSASIQFNRFRAGFITPLSVSFKTWMPIKSKEVISVFLPGFSGPRPVDLAYDSLRPQERFGPIYEQLGNWTIVDSSFTDSSLIHGETSGQTVAFWNPASSELQLKYAIDVIENTAVIFNIDERAGIRAPRAGVRTNEANLKFAIAAYEGPVLESSFDVVSPVGAFQGSVQLDFAPRIANAEVNLTVSFSLWAPLQVGDVLLITLPEFGGSAVAGQGNLSTELEVKLESEAETQPLNRSNSSNLTSHITPFNASFYRARFSWHPTNSSLALLSQTDLPSGKRVRLSIASSFGIRLPLYGVVANQATITMATKSS